ncbi:MULTISPECIES: EutN/CcmL family microcompartment protein [unclassified Streptococcus]|uniref:EutN/CcmL family microcompartment protein n=1 Tax=unclassified Streptococcus TaxID=2608887 RepID=UPI0010727974|nr:MULTISPECIES: EutN/CcmL family microcompartment protein [unclassified Streptococcus]MBF0805214.1 EutN/CcmL family microcompartment protein [Streptococcus sp. 19428wA2_WM07]TFU29252.1 ethanolamine utilization protein EutN [Streptococcus sp. WM07]
MFVGKVKGSLWATRKEEALNGLKFLVVERQLNDQQTDPAHVIAADLIGAGQGDMVLVTTGSSARVALDRTDVPIDMLVVGIIDKVAYEDDN